MWTRFMDMHSGGDQKEDFAYIYIEAPQKEAEVIFQNRFGHNPNRVTCTCCGPDYSIDEHKSLEQATAYDRGCKYVYTTPTGEVKTSDDRHKMVMSRNPEWKTWTGGYVEEPDTEYSFHKFMPLSVYLFSHKESVKVIPEAEIDPKERLGSLREEGYVWKD